MEGLEAYQSHPLIKGKVAKVPVEVESDSSEFLEAIYEPSKELSESLLLVHSIEKISAGARVSFSFCPRERNVLAHHLARTAVESGNFFHFFVNPLGFPLVAGSFFEWDDRIPARIYEVVVKYYSGNCV